MAGVLVFHAEAVNFRNFVGADKDTRWDLLGLTRRNLQFMIVVLNKTR